MRTIIAIVKADYCLMSQLLLNILSNVTLPPYPSFFVHFKHTFVTHPTKISCFSITVTPPPRDTACHPPKKKKILNVHQLNSPGPMIPCYGSINCNPEAPLPGIIRWEIFFSAKSPTFGDIDLSNRPWGSGWGTEWGDSCYPIEFICEHYSAFSKSLLRVILCLLSQRKHYGEILKTKSF